MKLRELPFSFSIPQGSAQAHTANATYCNQSTCVHTTNHRTKVDHLRKTRLAKYVVASTLVFVALNHHCPGRNLRGNLCDDRSIYGQDIDERTHLIRRSHPQHQQITSSKPTQSAVFAERHALQTLKFQKGPANLRRNWQKTRLLKKPGSSTVTTGPVVKKLRVHAVCTF